MVQVDSSEVGGRQGSPLLEGAQRRVVRVNAAASPVCAYISVHQHAQANLYVRPTPSLQPPAPRSLLRRGGPPLSPPELPARVYVTRGAMLHRATWKFSSLSVYTHVYVCDARTGHGAQGRRWCATTRGCVECFTTRSQR